MCKECLEGFCGIVVDVGAPGLNEGFMFGVLEDLGEVWFCEFVGFGKSGCVLVGCYYGLVEVGGDDACVDVIGQRGGVGVVLGEVVGEGDESCEGEGRMSVGGG